MSKRPINGFDSVVWRIYEALRMDGFLAGDNCDYEDTAVAVASWLKPVHVHGTLWTIEAPPPATEFVEEADGKAFEAG